jgi:ABC-type transport system substrate-binding protein
MPAVKRLVFKTVPDATTRAAMLKNGEVDVAYMLDAPTALELKRDPSIRLAFSGAIGIHYIDFFDQWDPKSPLYDRRVRLAAITAIDRRALNEAETLGASRLTGAMVPRKFEFALALGRTLRPGEVATAPRRAGYPNGLTPATSTPTAYFSTGERSPATSARSDQDQGTHDGTRGAADRMVTKLHGLACARWRATATPPRLADTVPSEAPTRAAPIPT